MSLAVQGDVLVTAVGASRVITAEYVVPAAIVIDVGTSPTDDGGLVGDVDVTTVSERAAAVAPVPRGVGPVTTVLLLRHTVQAAGVGG
ncbi:hypothetical protein [Longimycelium tulufanense]|uniref:hypothetical protein n=1 Tax=Longimycelium tulufanense TaxID=907463 RepID=UPI003570BC5C